MRTLIVLAALLTSLAACDSADETPRVPIEGFYGGTYLEGPRLPQTVVFLDLRTDKPDGDRSVINGVPHTTTGVLQQDGRFALTITPESDRPLSSYAFTGRSNVAGDTLQGGMGIITGPGPLGTTYVILKRVSRL